MTTTHAGDAVDVAYQAIRRAIIDGAYPAGCRLPEEELSERIGVEPHADPRRPSASSSTRDTSSCARAAAPG